MRSFFFFILYCLMPFITDRTAHFHHQRRYRFPHTETNTDQSNAQISHLCTFHEWMRPLINRKEPRTPTTRRWFDSFAHVAFKTRYCQHLAGRTWLSAFGTIICTQLQAKTWIPGTDCTEKTADLYELVFFYRDKTQGNCSCWLFLVQ